MTSWSLQSIEMKPFPPTFWSFTTGFYQVRWNHYLLYIWLFLIASINWDETITSYISDRSWLAFIKWDGTITSYIYDWSWLPQSMGMKLLLPTFLTVYDWVSSSDTQEHKRRWFILMSHLCGAVLMFVSMIQSLVMTFFVRLVWTVGRVSSDPWLMNL